LLRLLLLVGDCFLFVERMESSSSSSRKSSQGARGESEMERTASAITTMRNYRTQHLKEFQIMVEYKRLQEEAPLGVYLMPSTDSLRLYFGVIFLDGGFYKNGVFKFRLELPRSFPADDAMPTLTFTSRVFHPYVHPKTFVLNLKAKFPKWKANVHTLVHILRFLKKIFYMDKFSAQDAINPQALQLFERNPPSFMSRVEGCVSTSLEKRFANDPESTIVFTEHNVHHDVIARKLFQGFPKPEDQVMAQANAEAEKKEDTQPSVEGNSVKQDTVEPLELHDLE